MKETPHRLPILIMEFFKETLGAAEKSLDYTSSDLIRIYSTILAQIHLQGRGGGENTDIGGRSPILKVSVTILGALPWNSDRCTTVGDTRRESVDMTGFMTPGETFVVVCTIDEDMLLVLPLQFGDTFLNRLHTRSRLPCLKGRNVGMTSSAVPITLEGLGMKRNLDTKFLCNSLEKIACHPEMIAHLDPLTGTDLEFPLRGHDFSIDSTDFDSAVQAGLVVCLDDIAGIDFAGSDAAVVWTLWTGETTLRPAVGSIEGVKEGVFLFETEPRVMVLELFHQFVAFGAVVEFVGGAVRVVAFCEDEHVVPTSEGVRIHGNGFEVDI